MTEDEKISRDNARLMELFATMKRVPKGEKYNFLVFKILEILECNYEFEENERGGGVILKVVPRDLEKVEKWFFTLPSAEITSIEEANKILLPILNS